MDININNIISYIISPEIQAKLSFLKAGFLVFASFLLGFIIFALFKTEWLKYYFAQDLIEFISFRPFGVGKKIKTWTKISRRLEKADEGEYKLAIIEADEMLDNVLKKMGYSGKTLEERLKQLTSAILSNIDEVYQAHQIRNQVVRDPDYKLNLEEGRKILAIYEQALRNLQII